MTALAVENLISYEKWMRKQLPLAAGVKAWKGGTCVADTVNADVKPGVTGTNQLVLGVFAETVDNTAGSGTVLVNVNFLKEKTILWRDNDGTITAANLFQPCYVKDDHTVTATSTGASKAGTIMAVDAVLGVGFEVEGV